MNPEPGALDDRLRDAFQAAVDTVQPGTIRPEVLIGAPAVTPSRHRRRLTMFAPLAAAAAVVVAVGTALALPHLDSVANHAAAPAVSAQAPSGEPPFFLIQDVNGPPNAFQVRSAVTGQLEETLIPPQAGAQSLGATGTGTGRTFVLVDGQASGIAATDSCTWSAYTLRLTAAGAVASMTPLNVPGTPDNGSMSISTPVLSADGGTLAYFTTSCSNLVRSSYSYTIVVDSHGTIHRYPVTLPGGTRAAALIDSLSLSADGSELSYVIGDQTFSYPTTAGGAWVLPTSAPSGPAVQRAHEIFTDNTHHGPWANSLVLSSDGRTAYLLARTGGPYTLGYLLSAYNVRTGALIRVLHTWHSLPFQTGVETVGGDRALIWGWNPNHVTEVNLTTGATQLYLPRALSNMAGAPMAW
jgi:hypothetical protein